MFRLRNAFFVMLLLAAYFPANAAEPARPTTAPVGSPDCVIQTVKYTDNAVCDVIEDVEDRCQTPMLIDWEHLDIDRETPFTMVGKNIRTRDLVAKVFAAAANERCRPVVEVLDDTIVVTSRERMAKLHQRLELHMKEEIALLKKDGSAQRDEPRFRVLDHVPLAHSDQNQFGDVLAFLQVANGVKFDVDWGSLGRAGITRTTKVHNVFGGASLLTALGLIATDLGTDRFDLDYQIDRWTIRIFAAPAAGPTTAPADPGTVRVTTLNYQANSITYVVQNLREISGANIVIDWDHIGIEADSSVTGEFTDLPLSDVLTTIFSDAAGDRPRPSVETVDGTVVIVALPDRLEDLKARIAAHTKSDPPGPLAKVLTERMYSSNSLNDVLAELSTTSKITFDVDWDALAKLGITKEAPVSLRGRDLKFSTVLTLITFGQSAGRCRLDYLTVDGKIRITAEAVK